MNYLKKSLSLVVFIIMTTACSQDISLECGLAKDNQPNNRVAEMINNFYAKVHGYTRSTGNNIVITDISTQSFAVSDSLNPKSRTGSNQGSYDIHTVSVDFGETSGYVILSDTPGIEHIFCYTESGCISDSTLIPPLKDFIDATPVIARSILNSEFDNGSNVTRAETEYDLGPLVPYEWHQQEPYNNYATYCVCDSCAKRGNHMLVGCCAIAVGEVMATLKKFNGTFYGNRDINFDKLIRYDRTALNVKLYSEADALAVAHYLQEVAITCQTRYGCKASSSTAKSVAHCLLDNGYKVDLIKDYLDMPRYIMNLKEGLPHLVGGKNDKGKGHMWVVDGVRTTDTGKLMHCNWGWGKYASNGWYSSYFFYYDFIEQAGTTYDNSQYQLYLGGVRSSK